MEKYLLIATGRAGSFVIDAFDSKEEAESNILSAEREFEEYDHRFV
ncbi:hypothetical protein OSE20_002860 [Listeria innocua]|nr:hypothetical protein [Listeria innocua]EKD7152040.1 hypothetical protein [Listeria innocua]EKK7208457.1 hypothetical protein [Listeria innocua]HBN5051446.1 hypothetical protein [Listeria innocua]